MSKKGEKKSIALSFFSVCQHLLKNWLTHFPSKIYLDVKKSYSVCCTVQAGYKRKDFIIRQLKLEIPVQVPA